MKRTPLLIFLVLVNYGSTIAQFPYGTPNITEGNLECTYTLTETEKQNDKILSKIVTEVKFSTTMLLNFSYSQDELKMYTAMMEDMKRLPLIITANNFKRTYNENENLMSQVPRYNTSISYRSDEWKRDPCGQGIDELVHSSHQEGKGFRADPQRGVTFSLEGLKNDETCLIAKVFADGGWSNQHDIKLSCKNYRWEGDDCKWVPSQGNYMLSGPQITRIFLAGTDLPDYLKGRSGRYTGVEDHSYENLIITHEYNFFKIDTAQFFEFFRKKPASVQFVMPGSYRKISRNTDTGSSIELNEAAELVLTIGELKKNRIILSTDNYEDYHNWLPFRKGEPGYIPLKVKAELTDADTKDTIHLFLDYVTHYPGYCTNFPVQDGKTKTDFAADIRFARVQSDPNVVYVDTFHVKSNKKISEITVDIESYDYGGSAQLKAFAFSNGAEGYSMYNDQVSLILPEDENQNLIADIWEKENRSFDENAGSRDDSDHYPAGQKDNGDGYTLFEEYRGFMTEKDLCQNGENVKRSGKYIRTDPDWKDVFILDATGGVFENWYAPHNPARLNWHIVGEDQMRHVPAKEINAYISAAPRDESDNIINPNPYDGFLNTCEHRLMNYNTPEKLRITKHYGIFMFYCDHLNGSITAGEVVKSNRYPSLMKSCQYIQIQKYVPYEEKILKIAPRMAICDSCDSEWLYRGGGKCENCGNSNIRFRPYYDASQMRQIAKLTYEGAVIHEIGHNIINLGHHTNGAAKYKDKDGNEIKLTAGNLPPGEESQALITLSTLGVRECAMIYNFQRYEEWEEGTLLNTRTIRYCTKEDEYTDDFGEVRQADNCFGKISVK